jgi:small subunit ribosomal protein S9
MPITSLTNSKLTFFLQPSFLTAFPSGAASCAACCVRACLTPPATMSLALLRLGQRCIAGRLVAGAGRRVVVSAVGPHEPAFARAVRCTARGLSTSTTTSDGDDSAFEPILPPLGDDDDDGFDADDVLEEFKNRKKKPLFDPSVERYVDPSDEQALALGVPTRAPRPDGSYGFKGGRKRAGAFVTLKPAVAGVAEASFLVNGKPLADYFGTMEARRAAAAPVILTSTQADFVIRAQVTGGGMQGQADAVRHALALGIRFFKPEYRRLLRLAGFVTRDQRRVEAKKPGRKKARKKKTKPYR